MDISHISFWLSIFIKLDSLFLCCIVFVMFAILRLKWNIFSRYLNAIQTSAPHLLRYLATAFIVNKRRRPQFKDFIKVIQQEQHSYKDPITEFLACVYVNYDFDEAQKKMKECEEVSGLSADDSV